VNISTNEMERYGFLLEKYKELLNISYEYKNEIHTLSENFLVIYNEDILSEKNKENVLEKMIPFLEEKEIKMSQSIIETAYIQLKQINPLDILYSMKSEDMLIGTEENPDTSFPDVCQFNYPHF